MKTKWMLLFVGVLSVSAVFVVAPWQPSREVAAADLKPLTQEFKPTAAEKALIAKHVYGGLPSRENIYVRQGYVLSYAPKARCPQWAAYHVAPDYRKTPHRIGAYAAFNDDPDITGEATDGEYSGLHTGAGAPLLDRGHLAPFAVMGGDRDNDGHYAVKNKRVENGVKLQDEDDADDKKTVLQANYMSNIAPQHRKFNRDAGHWWMLEDWVRKLVDQHGKTDVWVIAGCVFGPGPHETTRPDSGIVVPPMFFKIVVLKHPDATETKPVVLAFLFPHQRVKHGSMEHFLVTVDTIEALTGLDFFSTVPEGAAAVDERVDTWKTWETKAAWLAP